LFSSAVRKTIECAVIFMEWRTKRKDLFMKHKTPTGDDLRYRAEGALMPGEDPCVECSEDEMRRLIHELKVHQVELELQNEELRTAQARLEESRMRYADLYDFAPVGYFTFDEQGRITEVNLTGAKQLGVERSNLIKAPFAAMVAESDRKVFHSHLRRVFDGRASDICGVRLRVKDGNAIYARLDSMFMKNAEGMLLCRTSLTDISDQKQAEEMLKMAHHELEKTVVERTAALASEVSERRRAEGYAVELARSNKELQEFAFIASHDLQEPLRKIQAFGTRVIARHGPCLDQEGRDFLQRMLNAAKRMSEMIQSLLDYSRVTTREVWFQKVDLTRLVREVVRDLEFTIERNGGRVEVDGLPEIDADPIQMGQLFQNLIGNALKFHGDKPPLVRIRSEFTTEPSGVAAESAGCRIFVEDNGIGIPLDLKQKIFRKKIYQGIGRLSSQPAGNIA